MKCNIFKDMSMQYVSHLPYLNFCIFVLMFLSYLNELLACVCVCVRGLESQML